MNSLVFLSFGNHNEHVYSPISNTFSSLAISILLNIIMLKQAAGSENGWLDEYSVESIYDILVYRYVTLCVLLSSQKDLKFMLIILLSLSFSGSEILD